MTVAMRTADASISNRTAPSRRALVSRIEVFHDFEKASPAWLALQADGVFSPYQSFDWVRLWHRHVSLHDGGAPLFIAGYDETGAPAMLLPFCRMQLAGLTAATWFGGKHATLNMALWRRDIAQALTRRSMKALLSRIAKAAPDIDLLHLHHQPESWHGAANPFALLPRHRSTEDNFILALDHPGRQIIEREISGTMRSRLRNKERKLAKVDGYRYLRAATREDVERMLAAFFTQKADKLASLGIANTFAIPGVEDFIRAACVEGLEQGKPVIELHALEGGGEVLALFSGISDGSRFTSMFNSHTASAYSRHSPGLILLKHLISNCADRGFGSFDIGPGEARYKTFFCKQLEPIFDSVLALSSRAHLAVMALRAAGRVKSAVKRNETLWSVASFVRRKLHERETSAS